jgi:hypothetical protein
MEWLESTKFTFFRDLTDNLVPEAPTGKKEHTSENTEYGKQDAKRYKQAST